MNAAHKPKTIVQIRRYNWTNGFSELCVGTVIAPTQSRAIRTSAAELFLWAGYALVS